MTIKIYFPITSAEQAERDAAHERKIAAASLEVYAITKAGREQAWKRLRALILQRSTSQVLRMECDLGLENLRAAVTVIPLHFCSAKVATSRRNSTARSMPDV